MMANAQDKPAEEPDLVIPIDPRDHAQGPENAPVTLVEYGDYECPHCGKAFPIIKRLRETQKDRLRFIFRHFPQNNVHPHASVAAQAAEAAGAQKKFWVMHDMLFEHQEELAEVDMVQFALRAGLEVYQFEADLSSERFSGKVLRDYEGGVASGVKGTPTLFLNGWRYRGKLDYDEIQAAVLAAGPSA
jgi:protein-disulfide isomerase